MKNRLYVKSYQRQKFTAIYASGGQNPFYKKGSGLPKIFHWEGLDTLFSSRFFAYLRGLQNLTVDFGDPILLTTRFFSCKINA
jgi:hypothetical protein